MASCSIFARTRSAVSRALAPGSMWIASPTDGLPSNVPPLVYICEPSSSRLTSRRRTIGEDGVGPPVSVPPESEFAPTVPPVAELAVDEVPPLLVTSDEAILSGAPPNWPLGSAEVLADPEPLESVELLELPEPPEDDEPELVAGPDPRDDDPPLDPEDWFE